VSHAEPAAGDAARPSSSNSPCRPETDHDPLEGISADGMIVTGACRRRIGPAFLAVVSRVVEHVSAIGQSHSVYVYGSVATGTARVGCSDVDLVTVGLEPAAAARIARDLSAEFVSLCRGVDIGAAQRSDYDGSSDEAYGNRAFLRHYCVHLAGPDVGLDLPEFRADKAAARGFNGDIGLCADRWRTEVLRTPYPVFLGRRVARKTLLAVAGLVSVHDTTWTTDRVAAAHRWGVLKPELADSLRELVSWSGTLTNGPSPSEVDIALGGVVAEVVAEFRRHIGLWR
jgi:uncharacterized protein